MSKVSQKEATMQTFKEYSENHETLVESAIGLAFMMDNPFLVTEAVGPDISAIKNTLSKAGLKLHKGKGLISYFASASKGVAKMFMAAIRGDKEAVKAVIKEVKKEDILDFLYKLDLATLHMVTGPIHFIDAVTGWDLLPAVGASANKGNALEQAKKAIADAIERIKNLVIPRKDKIVRNLVTVHRALGEVRT